VVIVAPTTATPGPRSLNKREFLSGLQCHKQLWWRVHDARAGELIPDQNACAVMEAGRQVGILARDHVPGGQLISFRYQGTAGQVDATAAAMGRGAAALYEATFARDSIVVQVDILERGADGWTLIEVKSSLDVKEKHLADAAIQAHVLRRSGVGLRRVEIMHLNRECRFPDLSNLFVREDVTERVLSMEQEVGAEAEAQLLMLQGALPDKSIGDHCSIPERCPFWDRCWTSALPYDVRTIYRAGKKVKEWAAQGWRSIRDLPEDLPLSAVAARQVAAVRTGQMQVEAGLGSALAAFVGPLAFLDFETVSPAIPRWAGCWPHCPVPVQLSCHLEDGDGRHRHVEWLADGPGDPRLEFARFLVETCAGARAIVSYNAGFEAECLRRLADALPQLAPELTDVERRLVDLLPVVRDHVYHPSFDGSFSLKQVLPALVPEMRYDGMEVAEGRTASRELMQLLFAEPMDPQERNVIRESLLAYCKQDTWAMVRLLARLRELAIGG
jgi:predicted RecB family nuclease